MRKVVFGGALVLLVLLATSPSASAYSIDPSQIGTRTIDPLNDRPQPVGLSSETALQTLLNQIYGAGNVDVTTDQQAAGMWYQPASGIAGLTGPILQFEISGNSGSNTFGIWSMSKSTPGGIEYYPLFQGAQSPEAMVVVGWTSADPWSATITPVGYTLPYTSPVELYRFGFGFYLECSSGCIGGGTASDADGAGTTYVSGLANKFWSVDSLNPTNSLYPSGTPQLLAYHGTSVGQKDTWAFAFEDLQIGSGSDNDHNDFIVTAESLAPVPEPASLVLVGTVVLIGAAVTRRRLFRA